VSFVHGARLRPSIRQAAYPNAVGRCRAVHQRQEGVWPRCCRAGSGSGLAPPLSLGTQPEPARAFQRPPVPWPVPVLRSIRAHRDRRETAHRLVRAGSDRRGGVRARAAPALLEPRHGDPPALQRFRAGASMCGIGRRRACNRQVGAGGQGQHRRFGSALTNCPVSSLHHQGQSVTTSQRMELLWSAQALELVIVVRPLVS